MNSTLQQRIKKYIPKSSIKEKLYDFLRSLTSPTVKSFKTVVLIWLLLYLANCICGLYPSLFLSDQQQAKDSFTNLIAIVATVVLGLFVVMAESLRDDTRSHRARVLMAKGCLFPLTLSVLFSLVLINITNASSVFTSLIVYLVVLFSAVSVLSLLKIMVNKKAWQEEQQRIFAEENVAVIRFKLDARLAVAEFKKWQDASSLPVQYNPITNYENYKYVYTSVKGTVKDLNLKYVGYIVDYLSNIARLNGQTFGWTGIRIGEASSQAQAKIVGPLYISKLINDSVNRTTLGGKGIVMAYPSSLNLAPHQKIRLEYYCNKAFYIENLDESIDQLERDYLSLKSNLIQQIASENILGVSECCNHLHNAVDTFLSNINAVVGRGYEFQEALGERRSLGGGWDSITWTRNAVFAGLQAVKNCSNIELALQVIGLPVRLINLSLRYSDHFVFQEFMNFPSLLYRVGRSGSDPELCRLLFDRSLRYLEETDWAIDALLRNSPAVNLRDYYVTIISQYQDLLLSSFRENDYLFFSKVLLSLYKLGQAFSIVKPSSEIISPLRQQMLFGFTAYVVREVQQNAGKGENFFKALQAALPQTLQDLTNLFVESSKEPVQDIWGWYRFNSVPDGKVYVSDRSDKITELYVYLALYLAHKTKDLTLSLNADSYTVITPLTINDVLNKVEEDITKFSWLINPLSTETIVRLKSVILDASEAYNIVDLKNQELIELDDLLPSIICDARRAYSNSFLIRNLFASSSKKNPQYRQLGYRQVINKIYIAQDQFADLSLFSQYGRQFAEAENWELFKIMCSKAKIELCINVGEVRNKMQDILYSQQKNLYAFSSLDYSDFHKVFNSWVNYIPAWKYSQMLPDYVAGIIDFGYQINVVRVLPKSAFAARILICDLERFGQFNVDTSSDSSGLQITCADLNLDENRRNEILAEKPDWLNDDDPVAKLKRSALVEVHVSIDFDIIDRNAGICLEMKSKGD